MYTKLYLDNLKIVREGTVLLDREYKKSSTAAQLPQN